MAAEGEEVHGEADLVEALSAATNRGSGTDRPSVLDAGCGTGRVAAELARRGFDVTGVDIDPAMLARARVKAPHVTWIEADLDGLDLGRAFDIVVAAGNVMIYLAPGSEGRVVAALACHLVPAGLLVAGFQLDAGRLDLGAYDAAAAAAGLESSERWATWDRKPYAGGPYAVSVHRLTLRSRAS
ncbi:MAG: class I SAM-dependent methyltransferase [Actinomycetota bacterium]|nr:class I SAM-dependent methyltransferase [Actinomycetota bacterium]